MRTLAIAAAHTLAACALVGCASPDHSALAPLEYASTIADRASFRQRLASSCELLSAADRIIAEAVAVGAPIYNAGSPLGCYRVYEGAIYKILDGLGGDCPQLRRFLRAGLARARLDGDVARKAWTLRVTFDTVLGESTRVGGEKLDDYRF